MVFSEILAPPPHSYIPHKLWLTAHVTIPSSRWLANDADPQRAKVAEEQINWGVVTDEAIRIRVLSDIGVNADLPNE